MLVLKLWNYFRGYVNIKVEGLALERFINMCIAKGIYLWDIRRINYTTLEAKISIEGFKELRKIVRRAGCRVSINRKNGYPFWIHKLKKRKMLLAGAFFCFLILIFSSTFIFSVEVVGNEKLEKNQLLSSLQNLGLRPGANRYFLNLKDIETQLILDTEEIAWVGIEITGIKARVEVVEKILAPDKIHKDIPCNVVAAKNGVIEKIIARNGDAVINEGDVVVKGDILISGVVKREYMEDNMLVHSYGEVYARTYYETSESKSLIETKKEKTGEKLVKKKFNIGSLELSLNNTDIPYNNYIVEKKSKKPFQWRNKGLPVEIITEEYYEVNQFESRIDENQAKSDIHKEAIDKLLEEIPLDAEILNTQIDFTIQNDVLYGKVIIEALENIAEQKILQMGDD